MGIIGAFTLTVGGIGVANIMYVVVQERTREIGIKRSVGAKRRNIMIQFFIETFFIIAIGGIIGGIITTGKASYTPLTICKQGPTLLAHNTYADYVLSGS